MTTLRGWHPSGPTRGDMRDELELLLCGVRGSTPAPGSAFVAVGGHTSCVAVARGDRWLVLDAGTGLRRLGPLLGDRPFLGTILLTHLHWDHLQGLPFLAQADRPGAQVAVHLPDQGDGRRADEVLAGMLAPPFFPIGPGDLRGSWTWHPTTIGTTTIEGLEVTAAPIRHKGGRTLGYRVQAPGGPSFAYLPDHAPAVADPAERDAALALVAGVDVLLHGGQFREHERAMADEFGHATVDDALALADEGGVGRVVLVHHAPGRTDAELAAEGERRTPAGRPVAVGREGDRIDVAAAALERRQVPVR